jgi:hypothetical protein
MYGMYSTAFALFGSDRLELWSHGRAVGILPTVVAQQRDASENGR